MTNATALGVFVLTIVCLSHLPVGAGVAEVSYTFSRDKEGGAGTVQVDSTTGRIVSQHELFTSNRCTLPNKIRPCQQDGKYVLSNESNKGPHLFIVERQKDKPRPVVLPSIPDELRVIGDKVIVTCDGDWLALVDHQRGRVVGTWNVTDVMEPPANAPQDAVYVPEEKLIVVSFQKDSRKGKNKGSRLAFFDFPEMRLRADLRLPRNHPELHMQGNKKEQGPGPEIVIVSRKHQVLFASLDLYGAVGLIDWPAARTGNSRKWQYIPSSLDGSWGEAYPDRATRFSLGDDEYVLVCNAGIKGGSILVSLRQRKIVWQAETPAGLEAPVFVPSLRKAFSVCAGKTKKRTPSVTETVYRPQSSVYVFDFSSPEKIRQEIVQSVPLGEYAFKLAQVDPTLQMFVIATGKEQPDSITVFDASELRVVDRQEALGRIVRFQHN